MSKRYSKSIAETSAALRGTVQRLQAVRADLRTAKTDLTPKVITWRNTIEGLQKDLEEATPYVQSLKNDSRNQAGDELAEARDLALTTIERISEEVKKLVGVLENLAFIPKTADYDSWDLVLNSLRLEFYRLAVAVSTASPSEILSTVLRAVSYKDNLLTQTVRGLLHKKVLLWLDLEIREEEYAKAELVEASKFIMDFSEAHGYFPTRIDYSHPIRPANALPSIHDRQLAASASESDSVSMTCSFVQAFSSMQNMIENNFRLTQKPKKKVPRVKSLREEIEVLIHKIEDLESELFSVKSLMRNPDRREWLKLNKENEDLKRELEATYKVKQRLHLEHQNLEAEFELKKKSYNALQTKLSEFNEVYMPRVNDIQELQRQLLDELQQIRQDAELLPVMFRNEASMKNIILEEKLEAQRKMMEAMAAMETQKALAKKYLEERNRKEMISLQAIAARNAVTLQLKELIARTQDQTSQLASCEAANKAYEAEISDLKAQYDNLQNQVFIQNNRINELEDQKKHLLEQLKTLGGVSKAHHTHKRLADHS